MRQLFDLDNVSDIEKDVTCRVLLEMQQNNSVILALQY